MKLSDIVTNENLEKFKKLEPYFENIDETDLFYIYYQDKFVEYAEPHLKMTMKIFIDKYFVDYIDNYKKKFYISKRDEFYINGKFHGSKKLQKYKHKLIDIGTIFKIALPLQKINFIDLSYNEICGEYLSNVLYFINHLHKYKKLGIESQISLRGNNICDTQENTRSFITSILDIECIKYLDLRDNPFCSNPNNTKVLFQFPLSILKKMIWIEESDIEINYKVDKDTDQYSTQYIINKSHIDFYNSLE